jgi:mevalonate kinase
MSFRAHGKVILLGEHAVVYGVPALAGALDGGAHVQSRPGRGLLRIPAWGVEIDPRREDDERSVAGAYRALRAALGITEPYSPMDFELCFEVPTGAGLGSSAAMAVAVGRALIGAHELSIDDISLGAAAMASETVVHGKPSGLDHTVALHGGFGLFVRGQGLTPIRAARPVPLVIGHTGRARDTKGRVARVAELHNECRDETVARFDAIAELVRRGRAAVESGDFGALGAAMQENQRHLGALECSCPEIDRMVSIASDAGAVGAKLTGGGGGGCVIAVAPGREAAVRDAWERAGFSAFTTQVGA